MMDKIIFQIEKLKPLFERISRNVYLRAIRDGFIAAMPVVLFSSIFMLVAYVPNIFNFYWSPEVETMITKPYGYTMGIIGLLVSGTTAKSLTDSFNRKLPSTNQINNISTMLASMAGFLLLAADGVPEGGFASEFLGTKGLLTAFLTAFLTVRIYYVSIKNDWTITMPEEVPPNISQTFKDIIPFSLSILVIYGVDLLTRMFFNANLAESINLALAPLFSAADGYLGLTFIFGAYAMFWFVGIHGPSIVEPAIAAIMYANVETNLNLLQAGEHADKIVTSGLQMFVVTMGGTGATLVVPFMFMWLAKSKRNKAIGRASVVPTFFGVNEPILFGAPIVLNPIFFIPFITAPIVNVWIFKFFVEVLGMNSFSINLPWTTPAPLGLILGTSFSLWAIALAIILIVIDTLIYYPFVKIYDQQILEEELKEANKNPNSIQEKEDNISSNEKINEDALILEKEELNKNVLVLCAGGGTSGLLANALNKYANEYNVGVVARAGSYGAHQDIMKDYDLIILAPQVASNYEDIKQDANRLGVKVVKTEGAQYIDLTRNGEEALNFIRAQF